MTKAEKDRIDKLHKMGCIVCREFKGVWSPIAVHHCTRLGRRDHMKTIGLCGYHHQTGDFGDAIHRGYKIFAAQYMTEAELLNRVNELLEEES
jgi:hypothetical protein